MMCCFSPPYLLMSFQGRVEQEGGDVHERPKWRGSCTAVNNCFRCHEIFPFSLSLLHHPTETRAYVNLCDGASVLSEGCLPGEAGSLLLMFSTTNFWPLFAPRTWYEVQGGLAACCWEQRCYQFWGGQQKDPLREQSRELLERHPLCSLPLNTIAIFPLCQCTCWNIYLSSEIWRIWLKNVTPENTDVLLSASSHWYFYQMLCHFLGRSQEGWVLLM